MNLSFTINRNGAIMTFTAILVGLAYFKATNYIDFILYVATAIVVGLALSELAWHLPSEDLPNQERIPPDYRAVAKTGTRIVIGIILIIIGLYVIFLGLGITWLFFTLIVVTVDSTLGAFVFGVLLFSALSSTGIGSTFYGGRMLLRLFKDDELEEAVKE